MRCGARILVAGRWLHDHDDPLACLDDVDQLRHRTCSPLAATAHPRECLRAVLTPGLRVAGVPFDVRVQELGDRVEVTARDCGKSLPCDLGVAGRHLWLLGRHGDSRRSDQTFLKPAGGVKVVAGPDYAHAGGGGVAVTVLEVGGDRVDQPAVGDLVGGKRVRNAADAGEAGREAVIPGGEMLGARHAARAARLPDRWSEPAPAPSPFQRSSTASAASRSPATPVTSAVTSASGTVFAPRSAR